VQIVDEVGRKELADGVRPTTARMSSSPAAIRAATKASSGLVNEVERRATFHFE